MRAGSIENGWVGKKCLRLQQVSPEVMNFVQSSESVVSSKYLLINWKKFSFYCVTESVVRPQRERASRPTFPETGDLFWLKQHRMWWKNYLREYTNLIPNKPCILPVSSSICFQHWFVNLKRFRGVIDFVYWYWMLCGLKASAIFSCR